MVRELVEVHRVVDRREVVVEQERRIALGHLLELVPHDRRVFVGRRRLSASSRASVCASAIRCLGSGRWSTWKRSISHTIRRMWQPGYTL